MRPGIKFVTLAVAIASMTFMGCGPISLGVPDAPIGTNGLLVREVFATPPTVGFTPDADRQVNVFVTSNDPNSQLRARVRNVLGTTVAETQDSGFLFGGTPGPTADLFFTPNTVNPQVLEIFEDGSPRPGVRYEVIIAQP